MADEVIDVRPVGSFEGGSGIGDFVISVPCSPASWKQEELTFCSSWANCTPGQSLEKLRGRNAASVHSMLYQVSW
jgi:hypothetical protein